jgi:hypothetical protein
MKTKETPASLAPESESALTDAIVPAFLTEEQAAIYLGLTPHQLYLHRCKGKDTGPPFVQHGVRVRYSLDDLKRWAAALPRFTSRGAVLASNPARAEGSNRQRATSAQAREARLAKRRDEAKKRAESAKKRAKLDASASRESANSDV